MDNDTKELIREALGLYRRHVEAVEAYSRRYSGKTIWIFLVAIAIGLPLLIPLVAMLSQKLFGIPLVGHHTM